MKYVLLFCGTREQQQAWEDMSEEARNAQYAQVGRWFAENRAKLGAKDFLLLQTKPNRTPAQKRIHLVGHLQMRKEFVAAQIESSND